LALWAGSALLLGQLRAISRPSLTDRLQPYIRRAARAPRAGVWSAATVRDVIGPLCRMTGDRLARVAGGSDDLSLRLERTHSTLDVTAVRVRQMAWTAAAFGSAAALTAVAGLGAGPALAFLFGAPLIAFFAVELRMRAAATAWQRRLLLELPVVSEQLGMLLSAGYSLGGALNRIATRGRGCCAADLRRACGRIRQGLSEIDALREWAAIAGVAALDRLVGVLALNREAGDVGRLIAEESRAIRREVQRDLVESIERRGQQVWIPVTVATLVPGVLFLAVPFVEALRLFTTT
jgi:Flp pilus assembly protein TadB